MEQGFTDVLQKMAKEQGKDILLDTHKAKALLGDYTGNQFTKESNFKNRRNLHTQTTRRFL